MGGLDGECVEAWEVGEVMVCGGDRMGGVRASEVA